MCPNSSVGSTLDIFPLILVDQRGHEFKSTLRNNVFCPFFSASNHIIFYIYVICMLYSTQIRSQKVWVVYVCYRFILEQCALNYSQSIKINMAPSDGGTIISLSRRPTVLNQRLTEFKSLFFWVMRHFLGLQLAMKH